MQTHRSIDSLSSLPGPIHLAIGVFDGLHLGHQEVIRHAREAAAAEGGTAVVVTFDPHPIRVLRPNESPRLLTSTRHKELILARLGVHELLEIPFTKALSEQTADEFIGTLEKACSKLGSISVGTDWAFGRGRTGNLKTLKLLGDRHGFKVNGTPRVCVEGEAVSSTRIRHAVEGGDFSAAQKLLGREYSVLGTIVEGRKIGRKIGFPTANLATEAEQLPPVGVYAVRATLDGEILPGVANLGYRPTVENGDPERKLEVHLLDFNGDIYGKELEVRFVERLRDEVKLPSLEALKEQIAKDSAKGRKVLGVELSLAEMDEE